MPRLEAAATPAVLRWARESIGLSDQLAAKRISVSAQKLKAWERGSSRPTFAQLRKAADVYKRPLAVFFLDSPPLDVTTPPDFRLGHRGVSDASPALRLAIRQAHARRESALDLATAAGEQPPTFSHYIPRDIRVEDAANLVRELLGISESDQTTWREPYRALSSWRQAVENLGIFVFQVSRVKVSEMRAFSIFESHFPVIAINSADAPNGRIFSLFHELAHVLTRSSALCAFDEGDAAVEEVELRCNAIAGHALVPTPALEKALAENIVIDEAALSRLATHFCVSAQVVLRRLHEHKKVSDDFFRTQMKRLSSTKPAKKGGAVPLDVRTVASLGRSYIRLALAAYSQGSVTLGELAGLLEVKVAYIDRVASRATMVYSPEVEAGE